MVRVAHELHRFSKYTDCVNFGARQTMPNSTQVLKTFTLAKVQDQVPASKRVADLEWRIKFTQMKLNNWRGLENGNWTHLKSLNDAARAELSWLQFG